MKNLIHRDLKPSNILFMKNGTKWKVKITDFDISKFLPHDKTSMTQSSNKGTVGYVAPEILRGEKLRKECDIFSLGVVFYYVLSKGEHPFGSDIYKIEAHIRDGVEPTLDKLKEDDTPVAKPLISSMIADRSADRPSIKEIQSHPLFWDAENTLIYLQEVSDYLMNKNRNQVKDLINDLESSRDLIAGDNWRHKLYTESTIVEKFLEGMKRVRKEKTIQDLLRTIRNLKHHYNDRNTPEEFRKYVGDIPNDFLQFFTSRFPKLLPHTYGVMRSQREVAQFRRFYGLSVEASKPAAKDEAEVSNPTTENDYEDANEEKEDLPPILVGSSAIANADDKNMEEKRLVLRNYQLELAGQALNGHNSLIIAPTGSGKTAVANEIIKQHTESGKAKCILFFVTKTALAEQQYQFFCRHLDCPVTYLIGDRVDTVPVGHIIKNKTLTVLTPQIMINELNRRRPYISFEDISMLVFDECHNTIGNHPYKVIMNKLLDYEASKKTSSIQIVGLTASPGVGKGKDRDEVVENLVSLLAHLNVTLPPSVVVKYADELKQHQKEIEEIYIKVAAKSDLFTEKITEEEKLFGRDRPLRNPPVRKSIQAYENWAVDLSTYAKTSIRDNTLSNQIVTYAEHLLMYNRLLFFNNHIPNAMELIVEKANFDQAGEVGTFLRRIRKDLQRYAAYLQVPLLEKLFEVLKKEFGKNPESRCIIFVPRKLIASCLVDCISAEEELAPLEPSYITGSHETADEGMTKSEQQQSLTAFRDGQCKILIATSVAEEGLDIRACNLVIMYNYVTGEVGRIQRAGRGRADNSRSILIALVDSKLIDRDEMNAIFAKASELAMEDLKEFSNEKLREMVREIQRSEMKKRIKQAEELLLSKDPAAKWKILCGRCKNPLTTGDKLRHINQQHRVVVDPDFESHVNKISFGCKEKIAPGVYGTAQFSCINTECREHLGLEICHNYKMYPALKIKQILFENDVAEIKKVKQWSKCPFIVEKEVDESEEENMEFEDVGPQNEPKVHNEIEDLAEADLNEDEVIELMGVLE